MRLPEPLIKGRLIKRHKWFLAEIELDDGTLVTAHCANPGSMLGVAMPGGEVYVHRHGNTQRKLAFDWVLADIDGVLVPVNASNPNAIVDEALRADNISEVTGYGQVRREVKYGERSRVDFLLERHADARSCFLEVKNVHLVRTDGLAEFPDSVTARGARHLNDLGDRVKSGDRAVLLYIVQRNDCTRFSLATDLDPAYAEAALVARDHGVEFLCYDCDITMNEILLRHRLPIDFEL
ncbi:MAG: DNA/RNA nuclease SfsA [Pseudomonadota bacterium]